MVCSTSAFSLVARSLDVGLEVIDVQAAGAGSQHSDRVTDVGSDNPPPAVPSLILRPRAEW